MTPDQGEGVNQLGSGAGPSEPPACIESRTEAVIRAAATMAYARPRRRRTWPSWPVMRNHAITSQGQNVKKDMRSCERAQCDKMFTPASITQRFCSQRCQKLAYAARAWADVPASEMSNGVIGAVSELLAAADLMRRGYEVFRALSQASSCDLVAMRDNRALRIEVRTGRQNSLTGTVSWPRNGKPSQPTSRPDALDHYAVVVGSEVTYDPELPAAAANSEISAAS